MDFITISLSILLISFIWFYYPQIHSFNFTSEFDNNAIQFSLDKSFIVNEPIRSIVDLPEVKNFKEEPKTSFVDYKLDSNLRALQFINTLENSLGTTMPSEVFTTDVLEDLLEIKMRVQLNILESTDNYFKS